MSARTEWDAEAELTEVRARLERAVALLREANGAIALQPGCNELFERCRAFLAEGGRPRPAQAADGASVSAGSGVSPSVATDHRALPAKFRKRPVVIEAVQYTAATCSFLHAWLGFLGQRHPPDVCGVEPLMIPTLEGGYNAQPGDWIIKGVAGEFYPCKPDIFAATYDPVEPGVPSETVATEVRRQDVAEDRATKVVDVAREYVRLYRERADKIGTHVWKHVVDCPEIATAEAHIFAAVDDFEYERGASGTATKEGGAVAHVANQNEEGDTVGGASLPWTAPSSPADSTLAPTPDYKARIGELEAGLLDCQRYATTYPLAFARQQIIKRVSDLLAVERDARTPPEVKS